MSLRAKLLFFFALLAILPLLGMGVLHYVQSLRTVKQHIGGQLELIAERGAAELSRKHETYVSDLLLLAENAETQRLFYALGTGTGPEIEAARAAADEFLGAAWQQMSRFYHSVELRDAEGATVIRLGDAAPEAARLGPPGTDVDRAISPLILSEPIVQLETGAVVGKVVAGPRLPDLIPREALETRFGNAGYTLLIDRASGRVLHDSRGSPLPWGPDPAPRDLGFDPAAPGLANPAGRIEFAQAESTHVAAFASLEVPPWTVLSVAAIDEFAGPFERMRSLNLLVVLLVMGAVGLASVLVVRRATRSLEELTAATGDVARGDFLPALPPAGADEVGRLSAAFGTMVGRIRETMAELRRSRQMAAVGEFASELAHEIRNPLTAVKLNLQRIERAVDAADGPAEAKPPLAIALREVGRLERVVRGVLSLARPRPLERSPASLHAMAAEALEVVRQEATQRGVVVVADLGAEVDTVLADADQVRGALLNLLLNGIEAMPEGGELRVSTALRPRSGGPGDLVELVVADTGPGIPPEVRERLFRPFFTTKPEGTGLGLAVALRAAEELGGSLELGEPPAGGGAAFRLVLPIAAAAMPAGALT